MRQFVILGHEAPTDSDFALDNLTGTGRMDLLARCVTASMLLSHGIREAVRTHLVFQNEFTVQFDSRELRGLHPDERSTAALVRSALGEKAEAIGHIPIETSPGVSVIRRGFEATVEDLSGTVLQLQEDGKPASEVDVPTNPIFVLSDHRDFTATEQQHIDEIADETVRLGPHALHADHTVTVAHNWCDTEGFTSY